MTLKEAILKSLGEVNGLTNYLSIYHNILDKGYYDFGAAKTPSATISAILGDFIRNGDTRVKRIKQSGGIYLYYLTVNEQNIDIQILDGSLLEKDIVIPKKIKNESFKERDLHKLLSSFLKNTAIYSKTIFHEQSTFGKDDSQTWTHPDMVGIKFLRLHSSASQTFLKSINRVDAFKISSYELKREINTDSELKKSFFQAVSNSSWANYGYLVAFDFSGNLMEEIDRLNQSFGIGVIKLHANPYKSTILYPARYRELDFATIDKLCKINKNFEQFIEQVDKLITADDRYVKAIETELHDFCDGYFLNDTEISEYCVQMNIPNEIDIISSS